MRLTTTLMFMSQEIVLILFNKQPVMRLIQPKIYVSFMAGEKIKIMQNEMM